MRVLGRIVTYAAIVAVATVLVGGCAQGDVSALGQIEPGQVVYADMWAEDNEKGDQALVEQKPSGMWVIDTSVNFRSQRSKNFDVKIMLDKDAGTFVVLEMGNTKVGKDHDDCLSLNDTEHYAIMRVLNPTFERDVRDPDTSSDDCLVANDND